MVIQNAKCCILHEDDEYVKQKKVASSAYDIKQCLLVKIEIE